MLEELRSFSENFVLKLNRPDRRCVVSVHSTAVMVPFYPLDCNPGTLKDIQTDFGHRVGVWAHCMLIIVSFSLVLWLQVHGLLCQYGMGKC